MQISDNNCKIYYFCWQSPLCSMHCYFKHHNEFLIREMSIKISQLFLYYLFIFTFFFPPLSLCADTTGIRKIKVYSFLIVFSKDVVLHRSHLTDKQLNPSFTSIAEQLCCTNRHRGDLLAFSLSHIFLYFSEHDPVQQGQNLDLKLIKLVGCTHRMLKELCSFISIETTRNGNVIN